MNFKYAVAITLVGLSLTGTLLQPLIPRGPSHRSISPLLFDGPNAGHGSTLAVLGGFQTIMADLTWLRAYVSWENRDAPATVALLELTTSFDPRPLYFWLNGARMIAYDMPVWLQADETSEARKSEIERRQAYSALKFLDAALVHHPGVAAIWIERANIELHRLHDLAAASESYRRASETLDAPKFAARIHAELLRRTGHREDALTLLTRLYPTLPRDDESAGAALVLSRIRSLELELGTPSGETFRP